MSGVMRYQRVSPDCLPLGNGKKPTARSPKEDDRAEKNQIPNYPEGKPLRARSSPSSSSQDPHFSRYPLPSSNRTSGKVLSQHEINGNGHGRGGDIVLQWGHNKRSRGSRAENRSPAEDHPSSSSLGRSAVRMHRRVPLLPSSKRSSPTAPQLGNHGGRDSAAIRSGEERAETRSPPKGGKMASVNGAGSNPPGDRDCGEATAPPAKERLNLDIFEWPRIYLSLSRKEKEDDFMAMKGSKLPQRPKKRPKNVEKALQFVFPGMWLSDLSRGRYEVREKKSVKKKRRGLKGMESLDSDSD